MAAHELDRAHFAVPGVPVFMYHDICAGRSSRERYAIGSEMFAEHLSYLREQGFAVCDLAGIANSTDSHTVVLTFDDGLVAQYEHAFPALLDHGLTATFFVTTSLIDSPGYLSSSHVREMSASGMRFGSHGHEHVDYSCLAPETARRELQLSRITLEDVLGHPVDSFSAPYGFLTRSLAEYARQAGFRTICSSTPWVAKSRDSVIPRLAIYCDTDLPRFSALAMRSALPILTRRTRDALLYLPKQILLRTAPGRLGIVTGQEAQ